MLFSITLHVWKCCLRIAGRWQPRTTRQRRSGVALLLLLVVIFCLLARHTRLFSTSKLWAERLGIQCDENRAGEFLDELCANYSRGYIVGSLCPVLCEPSSLPDNAIVRRLSMTKCLSHGNKVVIAMSMIKQEALSAGGENRRVDVSHDVVLKAAFFSGEEYRSRMDGPLGGMSLKDGLEHFQDQLDMHIKPYKTNTSAVREFLTQLRLIPANALPGQDLSTAQLHSMWSLLAQDEFAMLMLLRNSAALPRLLGSCGHAYVASSFPTSSLFSLVKSPHVPWLQRVRTALGFIRLDRQLAATPYGTLNLCDVQPTNFGIRQPDHCRTPNAVRDHGQEIVVDDGPAWLRGWRGAAPVAEGCDEYEVRAIDVDITFFEKRMQETLGQGECVADKACDFYDCHTRCDLWRGQCVDIRTNTNMQAICEKIFIGNPTINGLIWNGPWHVRGELRKALLRCRDKTLAVELPETVARIRELLMAELDSARKA